MRDKKNRSRKILVIGIIILFVGASIVSGIGRNTGIKELKLSEENQNSANIPLINEETTILNSPAFQNQTYDDDWDYWTNPPHMFSNITGNIGIGTSNPLNKLHIVGSESVPLVNIEQSGSHRGLRVNTSNACAIWVDNAGNHGLRITQANGDGVHITNANNDGIYVGQAGGWAGYFNGDGYFGGDVGINTTTPDSPLEVAGIIHSSLGGFMFPDGTVQTSAATGGGVGNTLDQAYNQGGSGAGRTINADTGAVNIAGPDGLTVNGFVGINTTTPAYELDVDGYIQADRYYGGDIYFIVQDFLVWRMYADFYGLYLENLITGVTYSFVLVKTAISQDTLNEDTATQLGQEIQNLQAENEELNQRISTLEMMMIQD